MFNSLFARKVSWKGGIKDDSHGKGKGLFHKLRELKQGNSLDKTRELKVAGVRIKP